MLHPLSRLPAWLRVLIALLMLPGRAAQAQVPGWQMAEALFTTSGSYSTVTATATDATGSIYLTGSFQGTVSFGAIALTSAGQSDVFVARWHPATGYTWAVRAGGTAWDYSTAVVVAGTSVYVAGAFASNYFNLSPITLTNLAVGTNTADIFVAKLTTSDSAAVWTWAQRGGGSHSDKARALAVRGSSVYVAGTFELDTIRFGTTSLRNAGGEDLFVAKLTDAGSTSAWTWAHAAGGILLDEAAGLAVHDSSLYVVGSFESDTIQFGATRLPTFGQRDAFVARLTDAGTTSAWSWARQAGGRSIDRATAVAVSGHNVYVTGSFESSFARFDSISINNIGNFSTDIFLARLTDAGTTSAWSWARQAGGIGNEWGSALAARDGNVFVAGTFFSTTASFGNHAVSNAGDGDVFVAKILDADSSLSWDWVQRAGGFRTDNATTLSISGRSIYVGGEFQSTTADFGSITLSRTGASIDYTGFIASLTDHALATYAPLAAPTISLFPNPARSVAYLTGAGPGTNLQLVTVLGHPVRVATADGQGAATLNVRGLPAGLYVLRGAGVARRFVVE